MPNGATHHKYLKKYRPVILLSYLVFEMLAIGLGVWLRDWWVVLFLSQVYFWAAVHYCWVSNYIDPDLDQLGVSQADGRQMRLGFIGYFFFSYWTFYAAMMALVCKIFKIKGMFGSAHRSWLTHSVFPGTFIRVGFLDAPIFVVVVQIQRFGQFANVFWVFVVVPFILGQLLGLGQADYIHVKLDQLNGEEIK